MDEAGARREREERRALTRALTARFRDEGLLNTRRSTAPAQEAADAAHRHLARSDARMVVMNLEDLWGETEPQNSPGTYRERPSWRRRAARTFESFRSDPAILGTLGEADRLRTRAAHRERRGQGSNTRAEEADA